MGSSQSILSPEAVVTLAVVAGAVGFGYSQLTTSNTPVSTEPGGKKGKKKKKASAPSSPVSEPSASSPPAPIVVPFPEVIPGGFDRTMTPEPEAEALLPDAPKSSKSKKKKKSKLANSTTSTSTTQSQTRAKAKTSGPTPVVDDKPNTKNKGKQAVASSASVTSSPETTTRSLNNAQSFDTDGSWTRVESRRNKSGRSVDVTTTSASEADLGTGTSSPIAERTDLDIEVDGDGDNNFYTRSLKPQQRRPLAERMLPKPRKTGVESMLETPDHPTVSRVMRVQSRADEQPALGFSWGDYEDAHDADVDGEDDNAGWDVVKSRRPRTTRISTSEASSSQAQPKKVPETLTKRQRQNAARREAQKVMKDEAEQERRATLAKHQRELESERIKEQVRGSGKKISGGMKAVVSDNGKLVWE